MKNPVKSRDIKSQKIKSGIFDRNVNDLLLRMTHGNLCGLKTNVLERNRFSNA